MNGKYYSLTDLTTVFSIILQYAKAVRTAMGVLVQILRAFREFCQDYMSSMSVYGLCSTSLANEAKILTAYRRSRERW